MDLLLRPFLTTDAGAAVVGSWHMRAALRHKPHAKDDAVAAGAMDVLLDAAGRFESIDPETAAEVLNTLAHLVRHHPAAQDACSGRVMPWVLAVLDKAVPAPAAVPVVAVKALTVLAAACEGHSGNQAAAAPALPAVVHLLIHSLHTWGLEAVALEALTALHVLGHQPDVQVAVVASPQVVADVVRWLRFPAAEIVHAAAKVVQASSRGQCRAQQVYGDAGAVRACVHLLDFENNQWGFQDGQVQEAAAGALAALVHDHPDNARRVHPGPGVSLLAAVLVRHRRKPGCCAAAAAALADVVTVVAAAGADAALHPGVFPVLESMVGSEDGPLAAEGRRLLELLEPFRSVHTRLVVHELPATSFGPDSVCAICLEGGDGVELPCHHVHHAACLATWWRHAGAAAGGCPQCRARVPV
jgi:hypothetical protein